MGNHSVPLRSQHHLHLHRLEHAERISSREAVTFDDHPAHQDAEQRRNELPGSVNATCGVKSIEEIRLAGCEHPQRRSLAAAGKRDDVVDR